MTDRKVAIVTAAAGAGIGGAISRQLAADGLRVIVTDLHEGRMAKLSDELSQVVGEECPYYALDVSDHAAVERVIGTIAERFGRIDVLVNNAGWSKIEPVAEMSIETWRKCLDIDLTGTFSCMRFALPHMIAAKSGAIVNISSISGWEMTTAYLRRSLLHQRRSSEHEVCMPHTAPISPRSLSASMYFSFRPPRRLLSRSASGRGKSTANGSAGFGGRSRSRPPSMSPGTPPPRYPAGFPTASRSRHSWWAHSDKTRRFWIWRGKSRKP